MKKVYLFVFGIGLGMGVMGCDGGGSSPSQELQEKGSSAAVEAADSSTKTEVLCAKYTNESVMGIPIAISSATLPSALQKLTEYKWTRKTVTGHILPPLSPNITAGTEIREIYEELELEWEYDPAESFPLGLAGILRRFYQGTATQEEFDRVQMAILVKEQRRRIDKEGLGLEGGGQVDITTYDLFFPTTQFKDIYISTDPSGKIKMSGCDGGARKTFEGTKK